MAYTVTAMVTSFGIGALQTVYAILHQFFNGITNYNSFNSNFRFSQTNNILKSFNSVLYTYVFNSVLIRVQ